MKEFIKNKLGVPENWDKHDYQLARYSFEDIEEVLLAYEKEQLRLGVVVRQSEQLCGCIEYEGVDTEGNCFYCRKPLRENYD